MSAEENKKIVLSFFENFSSGKMEPALAMMADNATWSVMGKPDKFALAGTKTLVIGTHFAAPCAGHVVADGEAWKLEV